MNLPRRSASELAASLRARAALLNGEKWEAPATADMMCEAADALDAKQEQARAHLAEEIQPDGGLHNLGWYLSWHRGESTATLDGVFTADDLEAIATWMRAHTEVKL